MKYLKTFEELDNEDPSLTKDPWTQRGFDTKEEWEASKKKHIEDSTKEEDPFVTKNRNDREIGLQSGEGRFPRRTNGED